MKLKNFNFDLKECTILSVYVTNYSNKSNSVTGTITINNAALVDNHYTSNIIYMKKHEDIAVDDLVLLIRKLYDTHKCTDIALDTNGIGLLIYDKLIQNITDATTGKLYPALSCRNDKMMAERCKVDNAPRVIWSIWNSSDLNNEIYFLVCSGFQDDKINLNISETEAKEFFREIESFEYEVKDSMVKLVNKVSTDNLSRYFSLAYNYWVQCQRCISLNHSK